MSKLKVMHVTPGLRVGGLPRVIEMLCRTIDRDRFDVSVLCLRARGPIAETLSSLGVAVHCLRDAGAPEGPDYLAFTKVARALRHHRVDVLHTHNTEAFIDGVLGGVLAGVRTMVHTDHGRAFPDRRRYMLAESALSRLTYRVVAVSDAAARDLVRHEWIPADKVVTIPNGIDGAPYATQGDRDGKRRELGIPRGAPVIGLGARLEKEKGQSYLIQALPPLAARFPDLALVLAGDGPDKDDLVRLARNLGVQSHVHFLGVRSDMPDLFKAFDVLVLPSVREGLPLIILEAMAAGCPVVATAVGGVPMAVRHEVNGLLVEPRNADQLAVAIGRLLASDSTRRAYGEAGRRIFQSEFTAEVMTRRYEALYCRQ